MSRLSNRRNHNSRRADHPSELIKYIASNLDVKPPILIERITQLFAFNLSHYQVRNLQFRLRRYFEGRPVGQSFDKVFGDRFNKWIEKEFSKQPTAPLYEQILNEPNFDPKEDIAKIKKKLGMDY